jgi:hypothetical protein
MDEKDLDALLDSWRIEPASMRLRDAVLATAPNPRGHRLSLRGLQALKLTGLRLWLAGAGVAAAVAGVSCGVIVSSVAVQEARDEALVSAAVSEGSTAVIAFAESART